MKRGVLCWGGIFTLPFSSYFNAEKLPGPPSSLSFTLWKVVGENRKRVGGVLYLMREFGRN